MKHGQTLKKLRWLLLTNRATLHPDKAEHLHALKEKRKEKRLPGLVVHAVFPIFTGTLEGFNNNVTVSKRIGHGYRDDAHFFPLVRFLTRWPNFPCSAKQEEFWGVQPTVDRFPSQFDGMKLTLVL